MSSLLATDRLKVHESCNGFIDEALGYVWHDDKVEKGEEAPVKIEDHSLNTARYGMKTTEYIWTRWLKTVAW